MKDKTKNKHRSHISETKRFLTSKMGKKRMERKKEATNKIKKEV